MKVYFGADHRGFKLAEELYAWLIENAVAVVNAGASSFEKDDDYVDYAADVGRRVAQGITYGHKETRGIIVCGSGVGVDIAANKISGIRSCLGFSIEQVKAARTDDNVNVLSLAADFISTDTAKQLVKVFLETPFANEERFQRRIKKLASLEKTS